MMKQSKKISVVMVTFNSKRFIKLSIDSVIKQTYKNWELFIINDGSTDNTKNIVNKYYNYKNIKLINLKKNVGAYKATDLGFNLCRGEYVAILDSDDISHPNRFEHQVRILNNNSSVALVATWVKIIDSKNKVIRKILAPIEENLFANRFPCNNLICNSSVMFRREILRKISFYDKNISYSYDYNFFLKIFIKYKIRILNKFYTSSRVHANQISRLKEMQKIIYKENLKHLKWSKNHSLININNIFLYYKNYFINYLKLFLNY